MFIQQTNKHNIDFQLKLLDKLRSPTKLNMKEFKANKVKIRGNETNTRIIKMNEQIEQVNKKGFLGGKITTFDLRKKLSQSKIFFLLRKAVT